MISKNKEELIEYTSKLANIVLKYRNSGKGTSRISFVEKDLWSSKTKRGFIENLITMIKDLESDDSIEIMDLKNRVHLMTNEEFGYFSTLLKFDYFFWAK